MMGATAAKVREPKCANIGHEGGKANQESDECRVRDGT